MALTMVAMADESTRHQEAACLEYLHVHADRLAALAGGVLGNPNDVDDVVQETAVAAWRAWGTVRDDGTRDAWITRICINKALSHRRWLRRHLASPLVESVAAEDAVRDGDWDRAFERLSRRQRAVVVLHYHFGYTLDEVADLVNRRPGTVRQHLARALVKLRREIGDG